MEGRDFPAAKQITAYHSIKTILHHITMEVSTNQAYINFQTVITGLRLTRASTSPESAEHRAIKSVYWIVDNSTDVNFINHVCEFLLSTIHHITLPEQILIKVLNCIDFQSIITSKLTRSNSFQYMLGSDIIALRNRVTSYRDDLPIVDSSFEVATDAAQNLFLNSITTDDHSSRTQRANIVENHLPIQYIADLYFENTVIPFLIYAPPHSGKTTLLQRINAHVSFRDTDNIRELDFYTEFHITNMSHLLSQALTAIVILPSPGEFKERCLKRSLPYQVQWYQDLLNNANMAKARAPNRIRVAKTDLYVISALMSLEFSGFDVTHIHYLKVVQKAIIESSHQYQRPIFESPGVM